MSSAAILAVYAAGYSKTRAAADLLEEASNERRPVIPAPATAGEMQAPPQIEPVTPPVPTTALSPALVVPATVPTATTPVVQAPAAEEAEAAPTVAPTAVEEPPVEALPAEEPPAPSLPMPKEFYQDGTYLGWGTSRHGDIQASVTVKDGRLVAASIAQCRTRYSCSWVAHLPPQVVARQSPDVDYVGGATQSANAFYWGIIDALKKAK